MLPPVRRRACKLAVSFSAVLCCFLRGLLISAVHLGVPPCLGIRLPLDSAVTWLTASLSTFYVLSRLLRSPNRRDDD